VSIIGCSGISTLEARHQQGELQNESPLQQSTIPQAQANQRTPQISGYGADLSKLGLLAALSIPNNKADWGCLGISPPSSSHPMTSYDPEETLQQKSQALSAQQNGAVFNVQGAGAQEASSTEKT
jgi:hypothetical protein